MSLKNFGILHLSDLHISASEDPSSVRLRDSLIEDIRKMKIDKNINIDAIAMTGDVVDKGGNDKSYDLATQFFNDLIDQCGVKRENIIFVPGNHDVPRRDTIKFILENATEDSFHDESKIIEYWEAIYPRFKKFNNFVESLTGRTDFLDENLGSGACLVNTSNGVIKFLLINSSWGTLGSSDYGKLMVSRWQLERLKENQIAQKDADITFALMHHPLDWFTKSEQKILVKYLTDKRSLLSDVILHGHIHEGKIEFLSNPDSSIISLVSGLGYPEKSNNGLERLKNGSCRYSIYNFDVQNCKMSTWLRISRDNGDFVADTQLYKNAGESGYFEQFYKMPQTWGEVSTSSGSPTKFNISIAEVDSVKRVPEWVGRGYELSLLDSKRTSVLAITGTGGQGKSALASEFLRRYSRGENSKYEAGIWIDCRELPDSLHFKIIQTLDSLSGGVESTALYRDEKLEDTVKRFSKYLIEYKLLLVFDNIDAYVKVDTEGPTSELEPFLNSVLNIEHDSLIIFTCRPSFIHDSADFYNLKLSGLSVADGIEFFKKRGVRFERGNDENSCKKIIEMTNGHPYWLGLIAGQINSGRDTLKKLVEKFSRREVPERRRIQEYFKNIWDQLNKERQKLLRYLVEAHRPLTDDEISILDRGPHKVKQELRRLERLGLVEPHESVNESITSYQVHPLIREFIHETFTPQAQEQFVQRVLYIFLPRGIVDILFTQNSELDEFDSVNPVSLLESLETCLNSRNTVKALALIEQYRVILQNGGFHHQYQSIACRILDTIDWEESSILHRSKSVIFIKNIMQQLVYMGEINRYSYYLKKYESLIESNTFAYLNYLTLEADIAWRIGEHAKSIQLCYKCEILSEKLDLSFGIRDVKFTKALALRESGDVNEALELFNELRLTDDESEEATYLGNCARCYLKLKDYEKAKEYLINSLQLLLKDDTYVSCTNVGYAYVWLAELMFDKQEYKDSKLFLLLGEKIWEEYAPGLMPNIIEIKDKYLTNEKWSIALVSHEEAKIRENQLLLGRF
ncbi:metallophosphoesterase [Paenibacillus sp. HB172176]|uniref:metallophosphoesterase n=1 Tax=Paenibacillus sp. HB172176 TaxID=2493690 RepID=UPI00143B4287|nr:metallophosphoesterase [Paenibacillus sp. HB172176]